MSESVFLQYVADTLVQMPEDDDLSVRVGFGTKRAARLLLALGDELASAGRTDSARLMRDAAARVEALPGALEL
ncbi:MAG: hypothetical protein AAF376_13100 [Pseudomonadota bacterium]